MAAGGFHLVPFLSQNSDALITASMGLAKYDKDGFASLSTPSDALGGGAPSGGDGGANFGTQPSLTFQTTMAAIGGQDAGNTVTEYALCTHATLKLKGLVSELPAPSNAAAATAMSEPKKPEPPQKTVAWSLKWRHPHSLVRKVVALDMPDPNAPPPTSSAASGLRNSSGSKSAAAAAAATNPPIAMLVVEFFSDKPKRKTETAPHGYASNWIAALEAVPDSAAPSSRSNPDSLTLSAFGKVLREKACPELRSRTLIFKSAFQRDEWMLLQRIAITNYWHERLEASWITAPEVYQYHCWALLSSVPMASGATATAGWQWTQVALSTIKMYVLPRGAVELLKKAKDNVIVANAESTGAHSFYIASIGKVKVSTLTGAPYAQPRSTLSGTPSVEDMPSTVAVLNKAGESKAVLVFVCRSEAVAFVVELQRVWEQLAQASGTHVGSMEFPVEIC